MALTTDPDRVALDLLDAQKEYTLLRAAVEEQLGACQQKREDAMRAAAAVGLTHRTIAAMTDLSHARIGQILGSDQVGLFLKYPHLDAALSLPDSVLAADYASVCREIATAPDARQAGRLTVVRDRIALTTVEILMNPSAEARDEREKEADQREGTADERERQANERERQADERDVEADERDEQADQRDG
jgi:hypothetical protein